MKKGVEMIASQFKASFEKLGIREVGQVGEPFDPALHNAVAHIESDELGENVISAVFQKGYMLGDKVVRSRHGTGSKTKSANIHLYSNSEFTHSFELKEGN